MQMGNTSSASASEAPQLSSSVASASQPGSLQNPSTDTSDVPASNAPPKAKKKPRTPKAAKVATASPSPALDHASGAGNAANGASPGPARKKQKNKKSQQNGAVDRNASQQTPINRFKAQHLAHAPSPYSYSTPPQESLYSPFPPSPSLVYFSGPASAQFERVLNASFPKSINGLQSMVRSKLRVDGAAPIQMSFVNTDANVCPLDDEYDLEALVANAAQAKRIKVQITTSEQAASESVIPAKELPPAAVTETEALTGKDSSTVASAPPAKPKATKKAPRQSKSTAPTASAASDAPAVSLTTGSTSTPAAAPSSDAPATSQAAQPKTTPLRWEDRPTPASLLAALWPSLGDTAKTDAASAITPTEAASTAADDVTPKKTKKESAKRKRQSDTQPSTQPPASSDVAAASQASVPESPASQPGAGKRPRVQAEADQATSTQPIETPATTQEAATVEPTPTKKPRGRPPKKAVTDKSAASAPQESAPSGDVAEAASAPRTDPTTKANAVETAAVQEPAPAVVSAANEPTTAAPEPATPATVKRKPGRPRKSVQAEDSSAAPPAQEPTVSNPSLATLPEASPIKSKPSTKKTKESTAAQTEAVAPVSNSAVLSPGEAPAQTPAADGVAEASTTEAPGSTSIASSAALQTPNGAASTQTPVASSQPAKPKARATKAKVDKCIVCKEPPSHAKEDCEIFKQGPQAVHDLLQKYRQLKSRKKEDRETVETLREWSNDLIRGNRGGDDAPLSQMSTTSDASKAPVLSQAMSTSTEQAVTPLEKTAEPAKKTKTKKSAAAKDSDHVPTQVTDAVELPPPSGVEATEKAATPAKKKQQKTSIEEPRIAVTPSSPLGPDASQPSAAITSPKRVNRLRAPSESSEAELATSPLLSAVPRADEDMDVDPLNATPSSTPDAQLEERRRKHKEADAQKASAEGASSDVVSASKGTRSASVTSSDTSEDSDSSESETQSEDDSDSEKTLNAESGAKTAERESESKSNGADGDSSSSSSSSSDSSSSSSDDSDSSSSSEDEPESSTPAAKKSDSAKSNGTPSAAASNPFLKGLTPQGNAKSSAAFSPKSTPFTRLSELKPSTLRQNMSQPSSPMSGGGLNGLGAQSQNSFFASKPSAAQPAADSSDSDSDSGSSSSSSEVSTSKGKRKSKGEPKDKGSSKRVIPASKRAGASTSPKKKKSVFSLFS